MLKYLLLLVFTIGCGKNELIQGPKSQYIIESYEYSISNVPQQDKPSASLNLIDEQSDHSYLTVEGQLTLPNIVDEPSGELGCLQINLHDDSFASYNSILAVNTTGIYGETFPSVQIHIYMVYDQEKVLLDTSKPNILASFEPGALHAFSKQVCFELDYSEAPLQVYKGDVTIQYLIESEQLQNADCQLGAESQACTLSDPQEVTPTNQKNDATADDESQPELNDDPSNEHGDEAANNEDIDESSAMEDQGDDTSLDQEDDLVEHHEDLLASCESHAINSEGLGKPITKSATLKLEERGYKITGDESTVMLYLEPEAHINTACIKLAGNQANVQIIIDGKIEHLIVVGRGNNPVSTVLVNDGAEVGTIDIDLKGNAPHFQVSGPGNYSCPSSDNSELIKCGEDTEEESSPSL